MSSSLVDATHHPPPQQQQQQLLTQFIFRSILETMCSYDSFLRRDPTYRVSISMPLDMGVDMFNVLINLYFLHWKEGDPLRKSVVVDRAICKQSGCLWLMLQHKKQLFKEWDVVGLPIMAPRIIFGALLEQLLLLEPNQYENPHPLCHQAFPSPEPV